MKKIFVLIIATVCMTLNMQASITVVPATLNDANGYVVSGWNPGELATFLSGSSEDATQVKAAAYVCLGSGTEELNQEDINALSELTSVRYLRMDNCFAVEGADFSQITIGSTALLDVTLPTGLTKEQVKAANDALKATATGLKTTSGISGTATPRVENHYYYTFPWDSDTQIELENPTEGQTAINFNNYPVEVDLTPASGYPRFSYVNTQYDENETITLTEDQVKNADGTYKTSWVPNPIKVRVTEKDNPTIKYYYNGKEVTNPYAVNSDGVTTGEMWWDGTPNPIPADTQLDVDVTHNYYYTYNFYENYNNVEKTLDVVPSGSREEGFWTEVPNNYSPGTGYSFQISSEFRYTYTDDSSNTQSYPAEGEDPLSSPDEDMKYTIYYTGTRDLTVVQKTVMDLTVDGVTIYVNEAGSLSDIEYMYTDAQNDNVKSGKIITVIGNVDNNDLGDLNATNFASAKLIDVSETTKANGADYSSLQSAATSAALFLPKAVTREELIALEAPNDGSRTCAYVDSEDESGNRIMHVYACKGSVANLAPVVDNKTALYFLKRYTSSGDTWAGTNYSSGNEEFRLGLGALHAISMDFTNYQAYLMPDFRHLTSDTHFLTVAQNDGTGNDNFNFTLDTDASNYKYSSDVWVVSTYKGSDNVSKTYGNGRKLTTIGETALITYIREEGKMEQAAPFLSDEQKNASRVIFVTKDGVSMTSSDIACIDHMNCNKIDFLDATVSDENLLALNNDNVKYVALPDNSAAITATSPDNFSFSNCASLLSVASYNTTTDTYRVHSTKNLDENGKQIESVYVLTELIRPKPSSRTTGNEANGLTSVEYSGYFNDLDIQTSVTTEHRGLQDAGSISTADFTNAVFPENHDMNFNAAGWENLTSINLPTSDLMTIIPANCLNNNASLTYLCIPYNFKVIEDGAFWLTGINHITTEDASRALIDNGPLTYTLSNHIEQLGITPTPVTNAITCPIFPQNKGVLDIYSMATKAPKCYKNVFPANACDGWGGFLDNMPYCRDKYFNGENPLQSFAVLHFPSEETYDAASVKDVSYDWMKKYYTDVNKHFTKKEQTGAVDANGDPIVWPTLEEVYRTFNQASLGLTWNDWVETYSNQGIPQVNGGQPKVELANGVYSRTAEAAGTGEGDYDFDEYGGWHQLVLSMATYYEPDEKIEDEKIVREYEDAGWYTFCIPFNMTYNQVVEMLGVPKSTDKVINKLNGVEVTSDIMPDIRQLSSVTRKKGEGSGKNIVFLRMTPNLYGAQTAGLTSYLSITYNENSETHELKTAQPYGTTYLQGEELSLIGGRPYIIKAYKRKQIENGVDLFKIKKQNLGKYVLEHYADQFGIEASIVQNTKYENYLCYEQLYNSNNEGLLSLRFAKPYENHRVQAVRDGENSAYLTYETDENGNTVTKKYYYTMVGQFWQQPLPQYCLYMSKGNWYRYSNVPEKIEDRYTWDPYKCVIMATEEVSGTKGAGYRDETKSVYPEVQEGTDDKLNDTFSLTFLDGRDDDDFGANGTSSRYIFGLDDDIIEFDEEGNEVTAIERLDGESIVPAGSKVYNVAGQYVGESLDGLTKGLYIVNGKKIVVK